MSNSIRTRLTILFIALATTPLLLLAAILAWHSYINHMGRATLVATIEAQRGAEQVSAFLRELENDLRQVARLQDLNSMPPARQRSVLAQMQSFSSVFSELSLLDREGRELARVSQTKVFSQHDLRDLSGTREFLIPTINGSSYFSQVIFDEVTGEPFITLSVPMVDPSRVSVEGVLLATVDLRETWDKIASVQFSGGSTRYIVDSGGRVVGHSNPSLVLRGTTFAVPEDSGIHRGVDGALAVIASEPVHLGTETLYVVTAWPVVEALAPTFRTLTIILALLFVSLVAAISLGTVMVRRIVQPVEAMAAQANAMTAGDLSQTVEVKGRDELAALAIAFNAMSARINDMVSNLEQRVAERTREIQKVNEDLQKEVAERRRVEEALREETRVTQTLHRIGASLVSELDLEKVVQSVTDEATELTSAEFGAFFYNVVDSHGESYMLYTLSGAPREAFAKFPHPRNTSVFAPTFRGEGPVRLEDVTRDPRYGKNPPYCGMPEGHLPVRSYLAVPVVSRTGDVLGGLFLGHSVPGRFTERHERLAVGIAAWAAVSIDNARLYQQSRLSEQALLGEVAERTRIAERLSLYGEIIANSNDGVAIIDPQGRYIEQNAAHHALLGYSAKELEDKTPAVHLGEETFNKVFQSLLQTGQYRGEVTSRTSAGEVIHVDLSAFAVRNEEGRVVCYVGIKRDITERKRAEEQLLRREQEFKALVENNPDNIARFDRDLRYVYINPAVEETTGRSAHELVGRSIPDTFHVLGVPQHRVDFWTRSIQRVFETGQENVVEYERHTPEGPRYLQSRIVPEFGKDGAVQYVLSIGRDITLRVLVERQLKESEERARRLAAENQTVAEIGRIVGSSLEIQEVYERFVQQTRNVIAFDRIVINLVQPDGVHCIKAYSSGMEVPGWDVGLVYDLATSIESQVIESQASLLLMAEQFREVAARYPRSMTPGLSAGLRSFMIVPLIFEGHVIATMWLSSRDENAYTQSDLALAERIGTQIAGAIANSQLYAERKRIQAELEVRARQQAVVAALGQRALEDRGLDGLMQEATELVARTLGIEYCKVLELLPGGKLLLLRAGVGWKEGFVGQATVGTERASQAGYTLLSDGPVVVEDLRTETRFNGPRLLVEHNVVSGMSVIIHGANGPFGVLGAHTTRQRAFSQDDVHFMQSVAHIIATSVERSRAEESLERHAQDLARSNAELEQFAYVASHDLQEPLRAIAGFTRMLMRRYQDRMDSQADDFMKRIINASTRMQGLIQDLLQYSRVGRNSALLKPVDTEEIVRQEIDSLQAAIASAGASVRYDKLPVVIGDAYMLAQVFRNLLSNAVKFHGKEPPRVHVSASARRREWVFSVKDNGIGIETRHHERIFVIFQRLHSRQEYEGTGIGLAICKKVIERLGGRIWVESQPGQGSTFYFTIPMVPAGKELRQEVPELGAEPKGQSYSNGTEQEDNALASGFNSNEDGRDKG